MRRTIGLGATAVLAAAVLGAETARAEGGDLLPRRIYDRDRVLAQAALPSGPSVAVPEGGRNPKLAMLYSLLIPGLGEHYLGSEGRAKAFFVAEGAIWTSFAVFRIQGAHRKDLYREFAQVHAGVDERDDDEFYRVIGNFIGSDGPFSANELVRREARAAFPNDRDAQDRYFAENAYTGDDSWQWANEGTLDRYRDMRDASIDSYHRSTLAIGVAVANRILSVVDTGLLASRRSRESTSDKAGLSWGVDPGPRGPEARVYLTRAF